MIEEGNLKLDGKYIDIPSFDADDSGVWLNVYACLREDKLWADKGHVVASEQFELAPYSIIPSPTSGKTPKITCKNSNFTVSAGISEMTVDPSGALISWKKDGKDLLYAPLEPYFWKPTNDNQSKNAYYNEKMTLWQDEASKREVKEIKTIKDKGKASVFVRTSLPVGAEYDLIYTMDTEGKIKVEADYRPLSDTIPLMPRFGMRMRLSNDMTQIDYLGRGPWENYPDRKRSSFIGSYSMPIEEYQYDYVKPQDNGNRCDVYYMKLANPNDSKSPSIRIEADGTPLCIRAWDYGEEDLQIADHPYELKRGNFVNINIDHNIHGVGGTDTWGRPTLDQYTIKGTEPHHYSFILSVM